MSHIVRSERTSRLPACHHHYHHHDDDNVDDGKGSADDNRQQRMMPTYANSTTLNKMTYSANNGVDDCAIDYDDYCKVFI